VREERKCEREVERSGRTERGERKRSDVDDDEELVESAMGRRVNLHRRVGYRLHLGAGRVLSSVERLSRTASLYAIRRCHIPWTHVARRLSAHRTRALCTRCALCAGCCSARSARRRGTGL